MSIPLGRCGYSNVFEGSSRSGTNPVGRFKKVRNFCGKSKGVRRGALGARRFFWAIRPMDAGAMAVAAKPRSASQRGTSA